MKLLIAALALLPTLALADAPVGDPVITATCYRFPAGFNLKTYLSKLSFSYVNGYWEVSNIPNPGLLYAVVNTVYIPSNGATITQQLNEVYNLPALEASQAATAAALQTQAYDQATADLQVQLDYQCTN